MLIRYYDHACFTVETSDATLIVFDPYDEKVGYPLPVLNPDIVLSSHSHMDHANVNLFPKAGHVISTTGVFIPKKGIQVTGFPSYHDDSQGGLRGPNIIYRLLTEGLSIVHLGDLGHMPSNALVDQIGRPDVLMIPVGGFYTIDADRAFAIIRQMKPKVIIPMHYKTAANPASPMVGIDDFLALTGLTPSYVSILRLTHDDIACLPTIVLMQRI